MVFNFVSFSPRSKSIIMLWFLTFVFLFWQIMLVMRTNKPLFWSRPITLKAWRNILQYKKSNFAQKDAAYLLAHMRWQGRPSADSLEKSKTTNEPIPDTDANKMSVKTTLIYSDHIREDSVGQFLNFEKESNLSKITILTTNEANFSNESTPRSISFLNKVCGHSLIQYKNLQFPMELMHKEKMQWVESVDSTLVYSAYHEAEKPNFVKIVAICNRKTALPYLCHVWYKEPESGNIAMVITNATFVFTNKSRRKYVCCYINCHLPYSMALFAVSVVLRANCLSPKNLLEVKRIASKTYKRNFTMCLSALHNSYDQAEQLVEWIEFNKLLGADHFIIYNFTSGQSVKTVLEYYNRQGMVEVLQWHLPRKKIKETIKPSITVHYFAQTSAYNDCLLRSKEHSKYVVITDVDEFIVPHVEKARTWIEMFKYLPEADSYQFRNCFFPALTGNNYPVHIAKERTEHYRIRSLFQIKRHNYIWDKQRIKYIARTATAVCLNTHESKGGTNHTADPSVGLLHHYRNDRGIVGINLTTDETVLTKYGYDIVNRVTKALNEINNNQLT